MDETLTETKMALVKNWEIAPSGEETTWEILKQMLSQKIFEWLERDPDRLVNAMYRLDVAEAKFKEAFSEGSQELVAQRIAELVLDREKQRAYWRNKYRDR